MLASTFGRRAGCVLASAALFAGLLGATSASAGAAPASSASQLQTVRALLAKVHVGSPNHIVTKDLNQVTSTNWSGYADDNSKGNTYSNVSGQWTEPSVKCISNTDEEIAVFWVGIDGYFGSNTVEQDGTLALCEDGAISYYDWWEMYPSNAVQIVNAVTVGDSFTSVVARTGHSYKLTVTDSTHSADSFSTTQTCSCTNSSAEWIAERPSGGGGLFVLPNFGTWTAKHATVKGNKGAGKISTYPDDAITMVNTSNQALVTVGTLNAKGNKFTATWQRSA